MAWIFPKEYEVIVVGAGHAGIEAALASARMGRATLLLTQNLDTIGQMSCNPSIGGIGKGHLVREIDALGGEMAKAADASGLQFKILNTRKGPAVQAPRVQCDKQLYRATMKLALESQAGLDIVQDEAAALHIASGRIRGLETRRGARYRAQAVVLTTGTFLGGLAHVGEVTYRAGRGGDAPSDLLAGDLRALGFEVGRLKTGTPMRLLASSIAFEACLIQPGDAPPVPVSHFTERIAQPQLPCWLTHTSPRTHEIIRANLGRSPLYSGRISSVGPRYCPSVEDKIVKFPEKERHQVFLEPEGYRTQEVYANGLFTSLPEDVQFEIVRSIPGLERAHMLRPGYAIEYDFVQPTQLKATFETKLVAGLFFSGQLNGTTGYEEAGAQGLLAGINAALGARGEEPFTLGRDQAYLGVLADDLVTKGVDEPYRMFTSRAEHRMLLRSGNADLRLLEKGRALGLIPASAFERYERYRKTLDAMAAKAEPAYADEELAPWSLSKAEAEFQVQNLYRGYLEREERLIARRQNLERVNVPEHVDFAAVRGLDAEAKQKLAKIRPRDLSQASRIPGITPADIQLLLVHLERQRRNPNSGDTIRNSLGN